MQILYFSIVLLIKLLTTDLAYALLAKSMYIIHLCLVKIMENNVSLEDFILDYSTTY